MLHTISLEDLDHIVLETLAAFVGGNAVPGALEAPAAPATLAWVGLGGVIDGEQVAGRVLVAAEADSAGAIAGSMLGLAPELCEPADIADVLGEVANTIGGNVKAVLHDGLVLSLPGVEPDGALAEGWVHGRTYHGEGLRLDVVIYVDEGGVA